MAEFNARNIRVSNGINADHPVGNGMKAMQACLDEKSGGKMKITAFWGGALGGDLQATQALRSGVQEGVVTSSSPLVGIVPALGVFDLPFLFADAEEADTVMDGEFGDHAEQEAGRRRPDQSRPTGKTASATCPTRKRPITKWEDWRA